MRKLVSVVFVSAVLTGAFLAGRMLSGEECKYTCPPAAVCDSADIDDICKNCVVGAGGPFAPCGCQDKDHKDYNPDGIIYHGSDLGGSKGATPNTVACIRHTSCDGSYNYKTYCTPQLCWALCDKDDSATNCWDCSLSGNSWDSNYIEAACFDCTEG